MATVRTTLPLRDRHDPPVDRTFDAACDLLIAARTFEAQVTRGRDDASPAAATLGVLDASLRALAEALPHLAPHPPARTTAAHLLHRAQDALDDAASACDAARRTVSCRR